MVCQQGSASSAQTLPLSCPPLTNSGTCPFCEVRPCTWSWYALGESGCCVHTLHTHIWRGPLRACAAAASGSWRLVPGLGEGGGQARSSSVIRSYASAVLKPWVRSDRAWAKLELLWLPRRVRWRPYRSPALTPGGRNNGGASRWGGGGGGTGLLHEQAAAATGAAAPAVFGPRGGTKSRLPGGRRRPDFFRGPALLPITRSPRRSSGPRSDAGRDAQPLHRLRVLGSTRSQGLPSVRAFPELRAGGRVGGVGGATRTTPRLLRAGPQAAFSVTRGRWLGRGPSGPPNS